MTSLTRQCTELRDQMESVVSGVGAFSFLFLLFHPRHQQGLIDVGYALVVGAEEVIHVGNGFSIVWFEG